jgi:hypothetical protein
MAAIGKYVRLVVGKDGAADSRGVEAIDEI